MSYDGDYPHIQCYSPGVMTREGLITALYNFNATCPKCAMPLVDGDVCGWQADDTPVEHVDCDRPQSPLPEQVENVIHALRDEGATP